MPEWIPVFDRIKLRTQTFYSVFPSIIMVMITALVLPQSVFAECKEFKIVEYEDSVEAVCVGEPLTEAEKKANLEEEKRQEAATQRQRIEEQKRQKADAAAYKAKADADAADERKKRNIQAVTPQKTNNKNIVNPINSINPANLK